MVSLKTFIREQTAVRGKGVLEAGQGGGFGWGGVEGWGENADNCN